MEAHSSVKKKQKIIAFGGVIGFVALLMLGMWVSDPNKGKPDPRDVAREKNKEVKKDFTANSGGAISAQETWIARSEKRFTEMQAENKALRDAQQEQTNMLRDLKKSIEENKSVVGSEKIVEASPSGNLPPPPISMAGARSLPPPPQATSASMNYQATAQEQSVNKQGQPISSIHEVNFDDPSMAVVTGTSEKKISKNISHYLPTGAFGTGVMLSGIDAPTGGQAKTNPVPILLRLKDKGQLPNYWHSDIDNCHVIGAGYGEISSERVQIRLETITCVLLNGDIVEEKITGYVTGEDGKAGFRGRLVSKQGAVVAKVLLAGIASGMGNVVSQQSQRQTQTGLGTVTTIDPSKVGQAGAAEGFSNSMEKLADYYMARANEMYPIIEVDANRIGEIVLTGGTDFNKNIIGTKRDH